MFRNPGGIALSGIQQIGIIIPSMRSVEGMGQGHNTEHTELGKQPREQIVCYIDRDAEGGQGRDQTANA